MCGIAGILTSREDLRRQLDGAIEGMIRPLQHRGPDDQGSWCDPTAGIGLGFRRLAIIDLSPAGHQPMLSASGRYTIVFNGEIYNYRQLRDELQQSRSYPFRGQSDTEVLLAAIERWGVRSGIEKLVGMFALAIWDSETEQLILVRDRLGIKPLFVHARPGLVAFASELKALMQAPWFEDELDANAVAQYLRYLYVPAPLSIFQNTRKLLPGHLLTMSAGLPPAESEPYWTLPDIAHAGLSGRYTGSRQDAVCELESLLSRAVRDRLYADVPLGALLSGGIDSSTVVALMQAQSTQPVRTFTVAFDVPEYDEGEHARRVAEHLGTDHTQVRLRGGDALELVPRLPDLFDEPYADPSQLPALLVCQTARKSVTVALAGDGGDEVFCGYNRYVFGRRLIPRAGKIPGSLRAALAGILVGLPTMAWDTVRDATRPALPVPLRQRLLGEKLHKIADLLRCHSDCAMYRSLLSAWQDPHRLLQSPSDGPDPLELAWRDAGRMDLLELMMFADQRVYLPDDLLAKADRVSMAVSLEVRVPMVDHRLVEFAWRLPAEWQIANGTGKQLLRAVLYRYVPKEIVDRPKMGFSVPIDRWLRDPLRDWGAALLEDDVSEPLDLGIVREHWTKFQGGCGNWGLALWAVLNLQAWRQRWCR